MRREVYTGYLKLDGEEHVDTVRAANDYAGSLCRLQSFEEAKSLLRKTIPVTRRNLGDGNDLTLRMRWNYARALCYDTRASLDDLREAVTTLGETERTARRVLGGSHPVTRSIEGDLLDARAALRAREEPLPSPWEAYRDDAGMLYYHNHETGESVWTLPEEAYSR